MVNQDARDLCLFIFVFKKSNQPTSFEKFSSNFEKMTILGSTLVEVGENIEENEGEYEKTLLEMQEEVALKAFEEMKTFFGIIID